MGLILQYILLVIILFYLGRMLFKPINNNFLKRI